MWLTPVIPYKPIRYSISLSVGYHPVCLRHRVPSTLRCVTPLQHVLKLIKRETEYIYWFIVIIILNHVFNLKNTLPNRIVLIVVLLVYHIRTTLPLWRPYYDRYPLPITDRVRYYRLAYVIQKCALSVILISFCVYHTSVYGYHNYLCNPVTYTLTNRTNNYNTRCVHATRTIRIRSKKNNKERRSLTTHYRRNLCM